MGLLRLVERFELSDWQDGARYDSLLQSDRRHWAWHWLKRNSSHGQVAGPTSAAKWTHERSTVHRLIDWKLKSLFQVGYLFIRIAWVMTIRAPGCFGTSISIRPSSAWKLNRYPAATRMPLTSPVSETWPI